MNNKKYWGDKEEEYVINYINAFNNNNYKQLIYAYNKLLPKIKYMIKNIRHLYFNIPIRLHNEVEVECITDVFLKLNRFDPTRGNSYTYISTLIKYHINAEYVDFKYKNNFKIINIENYDGYESYDQIQYPIRNYDYMYVKPEVYLDENIKEKILKLFDDKLKKTNNIKYKCVIQLMINYINNYNDFGKSNVFDYIRNNNQYQLNDKQIRYMFKQLFNINIQSTDNDKIYKRDTVDITELENYRNNLEFLRTEDYII